MKMMRGVLCACGACGLWTAAAAETVQAPFTTSPRHALKTIMGRDYWTMLGSGPCTDPGFGSLPGVWNSPWNNASLTNLPVFRDCGVVRHASRLPPDAAGAVSTWRTVEEHCLPRSGQRQILAARAKPDRPMVFVFGAKRNVLAMAGEIDLDRGDWAAFKKANPNLVGVRAMCEWGNDLLLNITRTTNVVNQARRTELEGVWRQYARTNRYDRLALCRWYRDRKVALHYDDLDSFMAFRGMFHLDHVAAAWGVTTLTAETTNTPGGDAEYRWDISGFFVRGAARQFGLPWCWYEAGYFNGPAQDGRRLDNSVCHYRFVRGNARPEGGTSASAQRRCWYYAYVNGANAVESESWSSNFFTTNTPSGKAELSDRGRAFSAFHDFTAAHPDRGVTYAPVAILVPFAQGYTSHGGRAWGACPYQSGDYALDAVFFTIAPGWERAKGLRAGVQEGNLHNSRFAMMYDVLTPDSPQPKADFRRALFAYPAAILAGDYADETQFADVLADYEKAGGHLVRVTAAELPPLAKNTVGEIMAGRLAFPSVAAKLESLQKDLFPFTVSGNCQYGANRTTKGWWLWVFNNRGVRKFADTFESLDPACNTSVTATLKVGSVKKVTDLVSGRSIAVDANSFTFDLPAGDLAIFEVAEKE